MKYCLSYDRSGETATKDNNQLLEEIIDLLIENDAYALRNPVETTIVFQDSIAKLNIEFWEKAFSETFENEIHFHLCCISHHIQNNDTEVYLIKDGQEDNFKVLVRNAMDKKVQNGNRRDDNHQGFPKFSEL